MRIIGVEFRVKFFHERYGAQQQELSVIPTDIEFHFDRPGEHQLMAMNGTLHTTTQGDITIPEFDLNNYRHAADVMSSRYELRPLDERHRSYDHRGLIIKPHR